MNIREALRMVGEKPGSIRARIQLAMALQEEGHPNAGQVWEAAARVAAAKGEFFHALALCRLYIARAQQERFLVDILRLYKDPQLGARAPGGYTPRPLRIQIPLQERAMLDLAAQVGTDLAGILPATDLKIPALPVFGELSDTLLQTLFQHLVPVPLRAGDAVIIQGQREENCFLLTQGRFRVVQRRADGQEVELARLEPPSLVGEIALLTHVSRRASVIAEETSLAWRLDSKLLEHLGRQDPNLLAQFRRLLQYRLISNLVRNNRLFHELEEQDRAVFLRSFDFVPVEANTAILHQGRTSPGLFILLHGKGIVAQSLGGAQPRPMAEIAEGQVFGAASFLQNRPATASVIMPEGGIVLRLNVQNFQQIRQQIPHLDVILQTLAQQQSI